MSVWAMMWSDSKKAVKRAVVKVRMKVDVRGRMKVVLMGA